MGSVSQGAGASAVYNVTSDERLKIEIKDTHYTLDDLMKIEVKDYVYKSAPTMPQTGFLAQQLYTAYPTAVTKGGEDENKQPWQVDYSCVTPLIARAVQELKTVQEAKISALEKELSKLEAENAKLKAAVSDVEVLKKAVALLEARTETHTVALVK